MQDLLPSPNITSPNDREQIRQILSYLFQLKEALEFILTNIGSENLSVTLQKQLMTLGGSIQAVQSEVDEKQQVAVSIAKDSQVTVSDVINSELFKLEKTNTTIIDARNDNRTPSWYIERHPKQVINELKTATVVGLSGTETMTTITTYIPWSDASCGYPKQLTIFNGEVHFRVGTSDTEWSAWITLQNKS